MLTIHISDEQLAQKLQQIAERENRSIEEILNAMIAGYAIVEAEDDNQAERLQQIRYKIYGKARQYWQSVGDHERAALSNEDLEESFGAFDEEGIPRLKSELGAPRPGTMAYAAQIIADLEPITLNEIDVTETDKILDQEFADYLLKQFGNRDGTDSNSN